MAGGLLTLLILLPLLGAVAIGLLGRNDDRTRLTALAVSIATLVLTLAAMTVYLRGNGSELTQRLTWIGDSVDAEEAELLLYSVRIEYHVGLDGISLWLLVMTAILTPLAIAASFSGIRARVKEYYALMLLLETGMLGVFCARDLLLFYVFFEFTLVPLFFLIGIWGGPEKRRAANKFFIYTMAGSMLTFAAVLYVGWRASQTFRVFTFAFEDLYRLADSLSATEQWWLFLALFAGFAIKVPLFPLHTWLPLAHTEAPTAGSVILAGVLLKLGTYGLMRFNLRMLPDAAIDLAPFMATLAIVGIVYGALVAWVQEDVKKLVAYSSVSHLGFCVLGMFSLTEAGLRGSLLYMINHGLSTGALFLVVGMVYERYHTRSIHELGGLARKMPVMAFFLIVFTLSSIGLPGLNGFVSEFLVLLGTFTSAKDGGPLGWQYAVFAALGIILSAVYMLWMCQRVLFGPVVEPEGTPDASAGLSQDLNRREVAVLLPIAVLCLVLGLFPRLVLDSMGDDLDTLRERVSSASLRNDGASTVAIYDDATSPKRKRGSSVRVDARGTPWLALRAGRSPDLGGSIDARK
jgi:NADH-quinone oxidoreductase subunit M